MTRDIYHLDSVSCELQVTSELHRQNETLKVKVLRDSCSVFQRTKKMPLVEVRLLPVSGSGMVRAEPWQGSQDTQAL